MSQLLIASHLSWSDDLWLMTNALCNPDDIYHHMSSGWIWHIIWMNYCISIMSSGWHTLPLLSHADEMTNFVGIQDLVGKPLSKTKTKFCANPLNTGWQVKFNRRNIYHVHDLQSRAFLILKCVNYLSRNPNAPINMISRTWCNEATIQAWLVLAFPTTCVISVLGYGRKWYECISYYLK